MKELFLTISSILFMMNPELKDLLGEPVEGLYANFKSNTDKIYEIDGLNGDFFGWKYDMVYVATDDDGFIESATIYHQELMNHYFYYTLVDNYGNPSNILVIDELLSREEDEVDNQNISDSNFSMKEGNFEDKPTYIIWNKMDYEIFILLNRENNKTSITFRKPTKEL
nr:hypothetical protein [uncultured Allomuricauda sp.]